MKPDSSSVPPYLSLAELDDSLERFLKSDIGTGDVTTLSTIDSGAAAGAVFTSRSKGIAAGLFVAQRVFQVLDASAHLTWSIADGESLIPGLTLGRVKGNAHTILSGERLALNLIQRMSGIATSTHALVDAIYPVKVRDTRKTVPGLNLFDKWAVLLGGGENHRLGLFDQFLVKDNHIAAAGSVAEAINRACSFRDRHAPELKVEVEVRTLEELDEALRIGGFDELLLDNMVSVKPSGSVDTSMLVKAVKMVNRRYITEASGNITLHSAHAISSTGVDYVSSGALTHSVRALDIAMKIDIHRLS